MIGVNQDALPADVSKALRDFCDHHLRAEKSERCIPYLARLRDVPMDSESDRSRFIAAGAANRMHSAFADLIGALMDSHPLVLVWEDLHWADHSSLGLSGSSFSDGKPASVSHPCLPPRRRADAGVA
ncbi:MAG: hypothetical protein U0V48_00190 [Anaerolineales bacterium]